MRKAISGEDPLAPEVMRANCRSVLYFFSNALFADRKRGRRIADKVFNIPEEELALVFRPALRGKNP